MRVLPIALGLGFRVLSIRLRPGQRLVSMPFILRFLPRLALSVLLYSAQGYHLVKGPGGPFCVTINVDIAILA